MEEQKDIFDYLKPQKIETPEQGYFDQLAKNVIDSQMPKIVPLYKKPIFWLSSAAAVIAIVVVFNFDNSPEESNNVLLALNDIPQQDVYAYIDENIDDFDEELLAEFIEVNTIEAVDFTPEVKSNPVETVSDPALNFDDIDTEDILEYLRNEEIDIYDLDETEDIF
jgi:hypothetical protein